MYIFVVIYDKMVHEHKYAAVKRKKGRGIVLCGIIR